MPDSMVVEPPTHRTITHTLQIRMDAQFAADYDRYAEVCRAVYNRAAHEAALDGPERRVYAPYKPKERVDEKGEAEKGPYLDRESYKLAKEMAEEMGVDVGMIRDMVRSQLGGFVCTMSSRQTRGPHATASGCCSPSGAPSMHGCGSAPCSMSWARYATP